jgi:hypothetical protein
MEETIGNGVILSGMGWLLLALAVLVVATAVSLAIVAAVWNGVNPFVSVVEWFKSIVGRITGGKS